MMYKATVSVSGSVPSAYLRGDVSILKRIVCFLVFLPSVVHATAYTVGTLEDWRPMLDAAAEYRVAEIDGSIDQLTPETRESAAIVRGFFQGLHDGILLKTVALAEETDETEDSVEGGLAQFHKGFCLDFDTEMVEKLGAHISEQEYEPNTEFLRIVYLFLKEEYPCQET